MMNNQKNRNNGCQETRPRQHSRQGLDSAGGEGTNGGLRMKSMLQRPSKSGWITLLQNRVILHCEENRQNSVRVYYDKQRHAVGPGPEACDTLFFKSRLKDGRPPAGWVEG